MRLYVRAALITATLASLGGPSLADDDRSLDACKPGITEITPELRRSRLDAMQTRYNALMNGANYAEALALAQNIEAAVRAQVGTKDRRYAIALLDLGQACDWMYDAFEASAALYKWALAIRERAPGPKQRNELGWSYTGLGQLYMRYGRFAEAAEFLKRAMEFDENADDASADLASLANVYTWQGKYEEAEQLYKRALPIQEKVRGVNSSPVAMLLNNLAVLYAREGRYAEAEALYQRVLPVYVSSFGANHPQVAVVLENLADTEKGLGHYAEAEALYRRSLERSEKIFGPNGTRAGLGHLSLGLVYEAQGRYPEAEAELRQALAITQPLLSTDNIDVANVLDHLGVVLRAQGRYGDAEPILKRALATREQVLGTRSPETAVTLDNLAVLYAASGDDENALAYSRRTSAAVIARAAAEGADTPDMSRGVVDPRAEYFRHHITNVAAAARKGLEPAAALAAEGLEMAQWAVQSSAAAAVQQMALRFASGDNALASLVRERQDLAAVSHANDKLLVEALAKPAGKRNQAAIENLRRQIEDTRSKLAEVSARLEREFPDYAALSRPKPLAVKDIQPLLADDEALVILATADKKSYVWAITKNGADWKELTITAAELAKKVSYLRGLLDFHSLKPFDARASFQLYQTILAPVEDMLRGKPRLSFVLDGALTSLPPQLLVTRDPTGKALKDVDWLIRTHAITVLPSVESLKVLRGKSAIAYAAKPLIGFANPVFNPDAQRLAQNTAVVADVTAARGIRGTVADLTELKMALPALPETGTELRKVAASVHADPADVILGADATETRVKSEKLDQFRIVYFATHGLLAGDVADFAKLNAEPALVLSLPAHPSELDDGLLTASEVAQLKLNADWVVLSACNTASAERPGAEALSGLARAFFYAGARSLVVSNWEVDSDSAVALMTGTFAALAANPKLSHAEALQKSMLAMINNTQRPDWADPKYWAPFVVVGEPAKPAN